MTVHLPPVGYPTPGKAKAVAILDAFCAGAGGRVSTDLSRLLPGGAAFYGVVAATRPLWLAARRGDRHGVFYLDNAYFDPTRETYFRATRARLQHSGLGHSDGRRFKALGLEIAPWRSGSHVLVCPQSEQFMREVIGYRGSWLADTVAALQRLTDREIIIRPWTGNKREWYRTLPEDLKDCHALVTYSSASAITALLAGVPAICTGPDCISAPMSGALDAIENPPRPDDRRPWAEVVADNQWTLEEMRNGTAWRMLCAAAG